MLKKTPHNIHIKQREEGRRVRGKGTFQASMYYCMHGKISS